MFSHTTKYKIKFMEISIEIDVPFKKIKIIYLWTDNVNYWDEMELNGNQ